MGQTFNEVLFDVMKEDMTTVHGLSMETGIEEEKIRSYLNGEDPDRWDAERIADALGVSMKTLFRHIRP